MGFKKNIIKQDSLTKRTENVLTGAIIIFACAFISAILITNARTKREHEIRESETVMTSIAGSIESSISSYKDLSRLIMLNDRVISFLRAEEVDPGIRNDAKYGVMDVLNVCNGVDSVFIFRNDNEYANTGRGEYIVDYDLMGSNEWQSKFLLLRGGALVTMNGNDAIFRKNGQPILSIGRAIYDINTQKRVGLLQFNISTTMLESIVLTHKNARIAILSDEGEFLAGDKELASLFSEEYNSKQPVYKRVEIENAKRMVSGRRLDNLPVVVLCAPEPQQTEIPLETTMVLFIILAAFAISIGISGIFVTRNITEPVNRLSKAMEETKDSGYLKEIDLDMPKNELGNLASDYNSMVRHLQATVDELLEKEKTLQRAEMRVLNEQLKPHFLYNSLETISFMAFDAGAKDVYSALETLGSFYRNFLSKGNREIPLKTEITIVRDYLALQKLRYGDIINDEYDIAEDTENIRVPKLILQPLVENSIYHGIRLSGGPGVIKVTTKLEGKNLHILVRDTGIGMSEDRIKAVLSKDPASIETNDPRHSSFGLKGTIERIRYYCNKEDVVFIRSEIGEFTEIELVIPKDPQDGEISNVQSNDN